MTCLKCGKNTTQNQVFCDHCLEVMDAFPVKPGTAIHLPNRTAVAAPKKSSGKKILDQEERLSVLKKWNLGLVITAVFLIVALSLTAAALVRTGHALQQAQNAGKNFTVDTTLTK